MVLSLLSHLRWDGFYPLSSNLRWDGFYPPCSNLRWEFYPCCLIWDEMVFIPSVLIWNETFIPSALIWDEAFFILTVLIWDEMVLSLLLLSGTRQFYPCCLFRIRWFYPCCLFGMRWFYPCCSHLRCKGFLSLLYSMKGCELTLFSNCNGELRILHFRSVFFSTCYMCCALLLLKVMTSYSRLSRQKSIRTKCLWANDFLFVGYFLLTVSENCP